MESNKPFFSKLLGLQELTPSEIDAVGGGTSPSPELQSAFRSIILKSTPVTLRYPSDGDSLTTLELPFKTE